MRKILLLVAVIVTPMCGCATMQTQVLIHSPAVQGQRPEITVGVTFDGYRR